MKLLIFALLVAVCLGRSYPLYKQCDSRWGNEHLGTSSNTICKAGCLMSSAAMALAGTGHNYNPGTLNTWLKANGGYASGDLFVWTAIGKLGLTYKGKISNSEIKHHLDSGYVVILNVHNGGHWVLAHGYSGDNILVNDPGFSTTEYSLSQIVNGNTGVYSVSKLPGVLNELLVNVKESVN
jgi:ABC-type bacteriocin/lantibiotic exporter with double-glycine peptidase domain